jgi:hypothetical protein
MKILSYCIIKTLFVTLLYLALVSNLAGAQNLLIFLIWLTFLVSLLVNSEQVIDKLIKNPPLGITFPKFQSVSFMYQMVIVGILVWYGWIFTACAYLIQIILVSTAMSTVRNRIQNQK